MSSSSGAKGATMAKRGWSNDEISLNTGRKERFEMSGTLIGKLIGLGFVLVAVFVTMGTCLTCTNIQGYELGVVHKYFGGVQNEPLINGFHCVWMGNVYKVDIGTTKTTFGLKGWSRDDTGHWVRNSEKESDEYYPIAVNCGTNGGQEATVSLTVNTRLNPQKVVSLYRDGLAGDNSKTNYKDVVLKREIIQAVNDAARPQEVLLIFSGQGFIDLHNTIAKSLQSNEELRKRGIEVTNVTVYQVHLDLKYEAEIAAKQLAIQSTLRKIEETKAANQEAKKVEAEAQSIVMRRTAEANAKRIEVTTEAEAQKQRTVLAAEAANQQVILAAQATAKQVILAAEAEKQQAQLKGEGEKLQKTAQAEGERALGLAIAQVEAAKRQAMYEGESGLRRATVEIATAYAEKLKGMLAGVKVLPKDAFVALIDEAAKIPLTLNAHTEAKAKE